MLSNLRMNLEPKFHKAMLEETPINSICKEISRDEQTSSKSKKFTLLKQRLCSQSPMIRSKTLSFYESKRKSLNKENTRP